MIILEWVMIILGWCYDYSGMVVWLFWDGVVIILEWYQGAVSKRIDQEKMGGQTTLIKSENPGMHYALPMVMK